MLGLSNSIGSDSSAYGGWSPADEASAVAWYQAGEGLTLSGTSVEEWANSISSSSAMTDNFHGVGAQPTFNSADNSLHFDGGDVLQSSDQITITNEFTIGIRVNFDGNVNKVIMGDNTTADEFIKLQTSTKIRIKNSNGSRDFDLSSGTFGDDYLVLTRDSSNLITLYQNGVSVDTNTLGTSFLIDCIGAKAVNSLPFIGYIYEIIVFSSESSELLANVNTRLASI
jgi:hypothetical protein